MFYYGITSFNPNRIWTYANIPVNRLYYIIDGCGYYILNEEKHHFKKNHVYLIPQHIKVTPGFDSSVGFKHCYIDFFSSTIFNVSEVIEINIDEMKILKNIFECVTILSEDETANLTRNFEFSSYTDQYSLLILNTIQSMLNLMLNIIEKELQINTENDERIAQAIAYIDSNYTQPISITDIANHIHLDKFYFIKLFKKHMNMTPYQYLKSCRLSVTINKIRHGESLTNVVEESGYSSIYSLSKAIKKHTGVYPSQL